MVGASNAASIKRSIRRTNCIYSNSQGFLVGCCVARRPVMKKNLLDTKTLTWGEIIGNGKTYKIPPYQRNYSWQEEHWEDLWVDIQELEGSDTIHYMGSIVIQGSDTKSYVIIDGQQRFVTLTLLILAAINGLQKLIDKGIDIERNNERRNLLTAKYIGDKDPVRLATRTKLTLNRHDDDFYQGNLVLFREPAAPNRLTDSEKHMWKAYKFFCDKLAMDTGISEDGQKIAAFIDDTLADRLQFIQITVENELDAYTVFETLNARGMELTATDLLKNYLFSLVHESDIGIISAQWQNIIDTTGMKDFPVFLRHYLNSRQKLVRKDRLFKEIKTRVIGRDDVLPLLDSIERNASIFNALRNPLDDYWADKQNLLKHIEALSTFEVSQPYPLILAAMEKWPMDQVEKILKEIVVLSFRYHVIGDRNPKVMENLYNKAAVEVYDGTCAIAKEVFYGHLKAEYLSDDDFKAAFTNKVMRSKQNKQKIRYILLAIESDRLGTGRRPEDTDATIEHILPENPATPWFAEFKPEDFDVWVYRLGNYTLLEPALNNRDAGNLDFNVKKTVYARSSYQITKDIIQEAWTPRTIKTRQESMANRATSIWRSAYM
jgi:hypothetical protein